MTPPRIGVSVMPLENRRDVLVGVATLAERLGYAGYFLPETWAYDVTVLMAEAAALVGLSVRQLRRLRGAYRQRGARALVHGNRERPC